MLHNEARKLVLEAWDKTHNAKEIAKYFSVNESTIYRLVEERTRTGSYETRTYLRGRKPILTEKQHQDILELVQKQPDITMNEIIEILHLPVGNEAVRRFLIKQGYTYKKKSFRHLLRSRSIRPKSPITSRSSLVSVFRCGKY